MELPMLELISQIANVAIVIPCVLLASAKIWHTQTVTIWLFRLFVGFYGLTNLAHFGHSKFELPLYFVATLDVVTTAISFAALILVFKNKHEVFAVSKWKS